MQEFPRESFGVILRAFIEENGLTRRRAAKAIGCPVATIDRLLEGITLPTDEMIQQVGLMIELGFDRYATLSAAEKERMTEKASAVVGGVLGLTWISSAVSAAGSVTGLSAAGISSGLAWWGFGGGMIAGIGVLAVVPLGVGVAGYGVAKGIKYGVGEWKLRATDVDPRWEIINAGEELQP